jgi:hypothetical protein
LALEYYWVFWFFFFIKHIYMFGWWRYVIETYLWLRGCLWLIWVSRYASLPSWYWHLCEIVASLQLFCTFSTAKAEKIAFLNKRVCLGLLVLKRYFLFCCLNSCILLGAQRIKCENFFIWRHILG